MTAQASKPDLVLLHGWGLGSGAWQSVLPALQQRFKVHPFSLPGYRRSEDRTPGVLCTSSGRLPAGRMNKQSAQASSQTPHEQTALRHTSGRSPIDGSSSPPPANSLTFLRTAEVLAQALPEGSCLCGWSLGALLAMQTAALAPQRFKRLILVGSTPRFTPHNDWPHAQATTLLGMFSLAVARNATVALQRFVTLLNQGDVQAKTISRTMIQQLLADQIPDTETLLTGLDWLREVDLRPQVARITTPALLIHGENDPLMPLPAAQWLKQNLPDAQLEVVAGSAHAPFLNDPEGFARRIGEFCDAHALD